jgi:hypothetical protein
MWVVQALGKLKDRFIMEQAYVFQITACVLFPLIRCNDLYPFLRKSFLARQVKEPYCGGCLDREV